MILHKKQVFMLRKIIEPIAESIVKLKHASVPTTTDRLYMRVLSVMGGFGKSELSIFDPRMMDYIHLNDTDKASTETFSHVVKLSDIMGYGFVAAPNMKVKHTNRDPIHLMKDLLNGLTNKTNENFDCFFQVNRLHRLPRAQVHTFL